MESPFRNPVIPDLELFETLRWDPGTGALRGPMHLARMARSAQALGFEHDPEQARMLLAGITGARPLRVRLAQNAAGVLSVRAAPISATPSPWRVAVTDVQIRSDDPYRGVKTTRRAEYDAARAALPTGCDEVIFLNEHGAVAEGSITNVFVLHGDNLLTPPLAAGCLPGVLRQALLQQGLARETDLMPKDLRLGPLFVGNSLRGLIEAKLQG